MSKLQASSAKKGPHQALNAYKEYSDIETHSQILAITMAHFKMDNFTDDPIPELVKKMTNEEQSHWLYNNIQTMLNKNLVTYDVDLSSELEIIEKEKIKLVTKFYFCGVKTCPKSKYPYKFKASRDSHERRKHNMDRNASKNADDVNKSVVSSDHIFEYQKALFSLNMLLRNINDCIREGDGERLIESYISDAQITLNMHCLV